MAEFKHGSSGTVFNMGLATLDRINSLLNMSSEHSIDGNYYGWYNVLFTLKRDVFPFLKSEDTKKLKELFNLFPGKCWASRKGKVVVNSDSISVVSALLDTIDTQLRQAMKDAGLLMPKQSDPRYSWAMEA